MVLPVIHHSEQARQPTAGCSRVFQTQWRDDEHVESSQQDTRPPLVAVYGAGGTPWEGRNSGPMFQRGGEQAGRVGVQGQPRATRSHMYTAKRKRREERRGERREEEKKERDTCAEPQAENESASRCV